MQGRPGYPLSRLLDLRRRIKEHHEQLLAKALGKYQESEKRLEQAGTRVEELARQIQRSRDAISTPEPAALAEIQRRILHVRRLEERLENAKALQKQAWQDLEKKGLILTEARHGLTQAEADLMAVEKNFQGWNRARRKEESDRAEVEMEEMVTAKGHHRPLG
jgi:hypothetical protein